MARGSWRNTKRNGPLILKRLDLQIGINFGLNHRPPRWYFTCNNILETRCEYQITWGNTDLLNPPFLMKGGPGFSWISETTRRASMKPKWRTTRVDLGNENKLNKLSHILFSLLAPGEVFFLCSLFVCLFTCLFVFVFFFSILLHSNNMCNLISFHIVFWEVMIHFL